MAPRGGCVVVSRSCDIEKIEKKLRQEGYEPSVVPLSDKRVIISWFQSLDGKTNYKNFNFNSKLLLSEIGIGIDNCDSLKISSCWYGSGYGESKEINGNVNASDGTAEFKEAGMAATAASSMVAETGLKEAEKWWINQTKEFVQGLDKQFTNSSDEYELIEINLLFNHDCTESFLKHVPNKNDLNDIRIMFHGGSSIQNIFENGFLACKPGSIGKLYGNGHYLTPQAIHAIRYLQLKWNSKMKNKKNDENEKKVNQFSLDCDIVDDNQETLKLIVCFVNCGKIKSVKDTSYRDKDISKEYDSHYALTSDGVYQKNEYGFGCPIYGNKDYKGAKMEEYAIKDKSRILPRFVITLKKTKHIFIWRDKKVHNYFNGYMLKELQKLDGKIYGVTDTNSAIYLTLQKLKNEDNVVHCITNGADDGEAFVKQLRNELMLRTDILVFCAAVQWHSKWAKKYHNVHAANGKQAIINFYKTHLECQSNQYNNYKYASDDQEWNRRKKQESQG